MLKTRLYDPRSKEAYKLSRSGLEYFLECPRCFYLDRRLGVKRPSGPGFSLNIAVDTLLKKEFDVLRAKGKIHPFMKAYGIKAIPFAHEDLDKWRHNFTGVQFLHRSTNFLLTGAVDDVWIDDKRNLIVVDYKATSTQQEITLDSDYRQAYKRQMEIYQWLLRHAGYKVSNTGYFVYCNGKTDRKAFDGKLEFDVQVIPYKGSDAWVEKTVVDAHRCLNAKKIPSPNIDCDYCAYRTAAQNALKT